MIGAAEKSIPKNFDLPEKWLATAARAKKLASPVPKKTRSPAQVRERPRYDLDENA
jgi:hypothetical protein